MNKLIITLCLLLYCCNESVKNLITMYLCCKQGEGTILKEVEKINVIEKKSSPTGSNESINVLMNMSSFHKKST